MATSADAAAFPGPDDLEAAATSAIEDFEAAADLDQLAAAKAAHNSTLCSISPPQATAGRNKS